MQTRRHGAGWIITTNLRRNYDTPPKGLPDRNPTSRAEEFLTWTERGWEWWCTAPQFFLTARAASEYMARHATEM